MRNIYVFKIITNSGIYESVFETNENAIKNLVVKMENIESYYIELSGPDLFYTPFATNKRIDFSNSILTIVKSKIESFVFTKKLTT